MKTKLTPLFGLLLLALLMPQLTVAQSSGGIGVFAPGIQPVRFDVLNGSLPAGYPEISGNPFATAGAGYGIISNFVIGGEGGSLHPGSFSNDDLQIELAGDYSFFSLGYVLLNRKGILAFPLVSVGEANQSVYIHQNDQTATFGGVTGEPFQATTLKYRSKMLRFSITGLYAIKGNSSGKGASGVMLGLTAGYQTSYKSGPWTYDNGSIEDGPDFSNNGFFIQLLVGGGGVVNR